MSRGPGKWQRRILEAVDGAGWCVVMDLIPRDSSRADFSALNRAAHLLAAKGQVEVWWRSRGVSKPRWYNANREVHPLCLVAFRPGTRDAVPFYRRGKWEVSTDTRTLAEVEADLRGLGLLSVEDISTLSSPPQLQAAA